ncbi:hypothetical protein [Haloarchaeobius sp. TZWWS8]|uniref:hypothetical protein n=1 Tax=Haloarchaeobius sp. TZWWS8 TaxID=3446121 RepID=UPI003EBD920C
MDVGETLASLSVGVVDAVLPTAVVAVVGFLFAVIELQVGTAFWLTAVPTTLVFCGVTLYSRRRFRVERSLFPVTRELLSPLGWFP